MGGKANAPGPRKRDEPKNVLVALWMNGMFGPDVVSGVFEWLRENRLSWNMKFLSLPNTMLRTIQWMGAAGILDGVISYFTDESHVEAIEKAGVPAVFVGGDADSLPPLVDGTDLAGAGAPRPWTCVLLDADATARVAADHFFSRTGFRSFGFVEARNDPPWSRTRGDAFCAELVRRGVSPRRFRHTPDATPRKLEITPDFDGLATWLRALPKPAAVLCANDDMAVDVIRVCELSGIAVPRDVAVLGMDDNPIYCQNANPNLSSVHFDGRQAGRNAAAALRSMMGGGPAPGVEGLRYGVVGISRRASTGAVSTAGSLVQKAVDYIDAWACSGISTADVVRHLGVSYSLATMRFRQMRGCTIHDAIESRRVAEAKRLLKTTDRTLDDIARACGWSGAAPFGRAFRAFTGTTPGSLRKKG